MSRARRRRQVATFACPNCGADVRSDALACPECGSDAETGWSDETLYDGLDLPWDGSEPERRLKTGPGLPLRLIAGVLLILLVLALVF
ncbi:zinc ribbon domain-containing protein [Engelhardtia mirabilis]|uniref:Putative zinc-ribbon domain-containing protein n=1 Tax=Engelhardtia mirabilis TaxID=2528011 RepID=A0A518BEI7_9BACT|nr:hypothetical protein Pla133_04700 [Planctomycetes bacterium Pla133]QDU99731.1 hypothetical protein Pla86_04700 [Planctomycetes bacterium Pla86]